MMSISYFLHCEGEGVETVLLGKESFEGITQVLIPDFSNVGHKVTITKFFEGYIEHRWLVKDLIHVSKDETDIYLSAWQITQPEVFLKQTYQSNRSVIRRLQFGTLVEVEFGYIPNVKKQSGDVRSNKRFVDTIHKGEMHKRRLCIVIKADNSRVQVVPITSKPPNDKGDLSICQITSDSLSALIGYNDASKESFALCGMTKSVALSRVLPPLAKNQRTRSAFRDQNYSNRLASIDRTVVKEALSHAVLMGDYKELQNKNREYYMELASLKAINEDLKIENDNNIVLKGALSSITQRFEALTELMVDMRRSIYAETVEVSKDNIKREVNEYLDILGKDDD